MPAVSSAPLAAQPAPEHPGHPEHRKGEDIVQQDDRRGGQRIHPHDGFQPRQQLEDAVRQRRKGSPGGAVAVGDQDNREHAERGDAAAVGQVDDFQQAEDGGKRQHDGALRQAESSFLLH